MAIRLRPFHKVTAIVATSLLAALLLSSALAVSAQSVKITTLFPQIEINPGQKITPSITLNNLENDYQTLSLNVTAPTGWSATLKSGSYLIEKITLNPLSSQSVTLNVTQPSGVTLGTYTITITATDESGNVVDTLNLVIDVAEVSPLGLTLSTSNPSIQGAAGKTFQFSVDLVNETGEERDIDLSYLAPSNWTVTFAPQYQSTQVRTVHMTDGARQTLGVTVTPATDAGAGDYTITVVATSGPYSQSLDLGTTITGTYTMSLTTSDGLLNMSASQGQSSPITLVVTNSGSGELTNLGFTSSTPSGWEVVFDPAEIASLQAGETAQVIASIKPASDAIPGDYSINLTASTIGANVISQKVAIRVTVLGSTVWGIIGLLIIVAVIAGMVIIFWRLGRR